MKMMEIIMVVLVLGFAGTVRADIVELNLFDVGCPTEFNWDNPYWQTNFDLGVTFTEISHVYIDWSGEITAGLASDRNPNEPFPLEVGIGAALKKPPLWRYTTLWGGGDTYPDPEPFDCLSEFLYGDMPWSKLLDGQGIIKIQYMELVGPYLTYVEHGFVNLTKATLVVEGVIVPEPVTILLVGMGTILVRLCIRRMSRNI